MKTQDIGTKPETNSYFSQLQRTQTDPNPNQSASCRTNFWMHIKIFPTIFDQSEISVPFFVRICLCGARKSSASGGCTHGPPTYARHAGYMRICNRIFCQNPHIAYFSAHNGIFKIA